MEVNMNMQGRKKMVWQGQLEFTGVISGKHRNGEKHSREASRNAEEDARKIKET